MVLVYTVLVYMVPFPLPSQLSLQLFDSRCDLHRASCNYALDLNCLHSKKTPHFLQKLVRHPSPVSAIVCA